MKKYILSLFLVGFLLAPGLSFATTAGDVDPNPEVSDCVSIVNNLRYKDRDVNKNGEVSTLQDFLQSKGYLNNEPTGYFGILTFKAVKDFQKSNGVNPTGYVGSLTRVMIKNLTCGGEVISTCNSSVPSITILSPKGGETYTTGQNVTVKWKSCNVQNIYVGLVSGGKDFGELTPNGQTIPAAQETLQFTASNPAQGFTQSNINSYQIAIQSLLPEVNVRSGTFTINSLTTSNCPSSIPSITVLSPNGGETYTAGQQMTIKWKSCNIPANKLLEINIFGGSISFGFLAPNGTLNDGSETITLGSDWSTASDYKIIVGTPSAGFDNSALAVSDRSDNPFTVLSATTGKYDIFATCLKDKGALFYGTFWCPHCQVTKNLFGSSANLLPYVECSTPNGLDQTQICKDKNILSYPTWTFADGITLTGEQTLQKLAEKTSCGLPN